MDADEVSLTEAVTELYEDLATRVGKELHAVILGSYKPKKEKIVKDKKERKKSPSKTSPKKERPTTTADNKKEEEEKWNMTPWRPKSPSKNAKKKKKVKEVIIPRRPFGPKDTVYPPGDEGDVLYVETLLSPWGSPSAIEWTNPQNNSLSAIMLASSLGREMIVAKLLSHSANILSRSSTGNTALHEASKGGHLPVVLLLLKAGSEVDAFNNYGNTPLSSAVRNGHNDVCEILVLVGASIDIKNNNSESPLDRTNDEELKSLLRTKRARFVQLSQKRIMAKEQELTIKIQKEKQLKQQLKEQLQQEKQAKKRLAELILEEQRKAGSENEDENDEDREDEEEEESEEEIEEEEEDIKPQVVDVIPVTNIISEFQQNLVKREKARAQTAKQNARMGGSCSTTTKPLGSSKLMKTLQT